MSHSLAHHGVNASYKNTVHDTLTGTQEIEFHVDDRKAAEQFLTALGLVPYRRQEKRGHTFRLNGRHQRYRYLAQRPTWSTYTIPGRVIRYFTFTRIE